ncbi:MAG: GTP pyrophosphokinase [Methylotenera sp.]|uniref:RelA/SpoT family protein n=1 Tax=Methylotenera sp. TaxID=2051956 RepID=UPI000D3FA886|nr:bifunctional (p)ppGpp synthetase/guanosine-3',5'-bis(diphosphate) 3'-pyrophosphohydrolase [Methylotenera sp.]PPC80615.1 MAG: GTP pyrophosphokinase [Methylotenera sp.]
MIHGSSALQIPALSDHDTQVWIASLAKHLSPAEVELVRQACELATLAYASQTEITGLPLLQHATGTAAILISLNMDAETIIATILYAVPAHIDNWQETLKARFGNNIVQLVEGFLRIQQVQEFSEFEDLQAQASESADNSRQIESLRKMLLAMVQDIRVVLIKLAERTHTLRYLAGASEAQQKQIARGIQGVFSPLANRLGVWQLKWEMEDLSLRYLEPQLYKEVAKLLDSRRVDREQYIQHVEDTLRQKLAQAGIKGEVSGRPKHIYSIINKMRRKNLDFEQLFDVRAVRILVDDVKDCYTALSLVQTLWQPIPGEFDDYIARPKGNNYRSLHTAVHGPQGLALEVQIRTYEMHEYSELGVAAHWRYKEGGKSDIVLDEKIAWLRQILSWKEASKDSGDILEQFKSELFQDNVYVFTPQGRVVDLPKDATPIDFAYALHTDLGHRTRGAKVDGHIVPLNYKLQNAERVEILTTKIGSPSRDWLSPTLGYLKSASARAKVRHWFKHQHAEENIANGRAKLDKELNRAGAGSVNQEKIAQKLHFNKLDDCLNAIGRGDVSEHQIATAIQELMHPKPVEKVSHVAVRKAPNHVSPTEVILEGVGNLQTNMAKCCKPAFPDNIVGYVTRDRGVTIHRESCTFIKRLDEARRDRLLNAQWRANKK